MVLAADTEKFFDRALVRNAYGWAIGHGGMLLGWEHGNWDPLEVN